MNSYKMHIPPRSWMESSKSQQWDERSRLQQYSNEIYWQANQWASTQSIWILHTIVIKDSMIAHNWDSSNTSHRVVVAPKMKWRDKVARSSGASTQTTPTMEQSSHENRSSYNTVALFITIFIVSIFKTIFTCSGHNFMLKSQLHVDVWEHSSTQHAAVWVDLGF